AITDYTGSGPFKFVQKEFQPGVKTVYEKNTDYVPRKEAPSWTAGGKVVNVDRVEWVAMADPMTTVNALLGGEVDYIETVPFDLVPMVKSSPPDVAGAGQDGLPAHVSLQPAQRAFRQQAGAPGRHVRGRPGRHPEGAGRR
ncbi:ABC transporter substrate-binding protein, partial [Leclercia adecarboxylata]|uniref:ABC transporter substrate-binding protein n=1 Tax=Leclercia adecarboxylata TaxID=83655 RepID=UPI00234C6E61